MSIKKSHKFTAQFLEEVAAETRYRKLGVRVGGSSWIMLPIVSRRGVAKRSWTMATNFPNLAGT